MHRVWAIVNTEHMLGIVTNLTPIPDLNEPNDGVTTLHNILQLSKQIGQRGQK